MDKFTKEAFTAMKVADVNKLVTVINAAEKEIAKKDAKIAMLEAKIVAMKEMAAAAKAAKATKAKKSK